MRNIILYGAEPSPFVRKVRLALAFKGIEYTQIPVFPFSPEKPAEFTENSPTGKIPLMFIDGNYISDSDVILDFIEREFPQSALLPADNLLAARANWFNTYASTVMIPAIGGHLFAEVFLAQAFFNRARLQEDIDLAINQEIPDIFSYLEKELADDYLVGNAMTLADLSVCGIFVLMRHCKFNCDHHKWPKVSAYIDRVHGSELFQSIINEEVELLTQYGVDYPNVSV